MCSHPFRYRGSRLRADNRASLTAVTEKLARALVSAPSESVTYTEKIELVLGSSLVFHRVTTQDLFPGAIGDGLDAVSESTAVLLFHLSSDAVCVGEREHIFRRLITNVNEDGSALNFHRSEVQ